MLSNVEPRLEIVVEVEKHALGISDSHLLVVKRDVTAGIACCETNSMAMISRPGGS